MGFNSLVFSTPAYGEAAVNLRNGLIYNVSDLLAASYNPGIRPSPGQTNSPPSNVDPNAGRPPRIANWNIGFQREITKDLSVEAAYVGNRGVWFRANSLVDYQRHSGGSPARVRPRHPQRRGPHAAHLPHGFPGA